MSTVEDTSIGTCDSCNQVATLHVQSDDGVICEGCEDKNEQFQFELGSIGELVRNHTECAGC